MSFIDTVKAFFKAPKVDSVAIAVHDAFSDAYNAAFHAIEPYTTRANHRLAILSARSALNKAPLDDPYAADAYDEAVAAYTDPADFDAYTEDYLEAHTAAMEVLTAAFDTLTAAFAAFNPADDLYTSAAALYKAYCDSYTFAAAAYSNAAHCAMATALEGDLQAAKDDFQLMLLETRAANAADAVTAKAKAAAFKVKAAEDATKAKLLEQKARVAETKAEVFLTKAKSAEARAEEALAITKRLEEEADAARIRIRQQMTTPVQVLRWICVLPGAVLCALLVAFPIHWIVMLIQLFGTSDDSFITIDGKNLLAAIPPENLERFGQALFAPFVVVSGGARIAPRYRFRTGIALTVLFVVGLIVAHIFVASWGFNLAGGWFQRSFTHFLQVVGFSWGLYHAHEADKNA